MSEPVKGWAMMEMDDLDIPSLVREVRKQLGLSQEELAHQLGVSFSTINRWENGKTTPFKLARAQLTAFCRKMAKKGKLKL